MAKRTDIDRSAIYAAGQKWVDVALRREDSLFTPGRRALAERNLGESPHTLLYPDVFPCAY